MGGSGTTTYSTSASHEGSDGNRHTPPVKDKMNDLKKVVTAQEHQISLLCNQVAFLRLSFTRGLGNVVEPAPYHDGYAVHVQYARAIHRCILAAKSRVIRVQMEGAATTLTLPKLPFGGDRDMGTVMKITDHEVFFGFIDYFYLASPLSSMATTLQHMWKDLLVLATEYEVAGLKEQCERYVQDKVDFNQHSILPILWIGLKYNSGAIVERAIELNFEGPQSLLDRGGKPYKKLVQSFPHVDDMMSQAERAHEISDDEDENEYHMVNTSLHLDVRSRSFVGSFDVDIDSTL